MSCSATYEFIPVLVLVEEKAKEYAYTHQVLARLEEFSPEIIWVKDDQEALDKLKQSRKKKHVYLTVNRGSFIRLKQFGKDCTSGQAAYCLDHVTGCHFACVYCYLHTYLKNDPLVRIHVNIEDLFQEIEHLQASTQEPLFMSTGELSDSLLFDWMTNFVEEAYLFLKDKPQIGMEFRSKSSYDQCLKKIAPLPNMYFTWTLSPEQVVKEYELKTASLSERIRCLKTAQEQGFHTGIIVDPMIHYPQWKEGYQEMVQELAKSVDISKIERLFIGSFRYMKGMDKDIEEKFPKTDLFVNEFVLARDGKYRYYKPIREEMYAWLKELFDQHAGPVRLSMEFPETWRKIIGEDSLPLQDLH